MQNYVNSSVINCTKSSSPDGFRWFLGADVAGRDSCESLLRHNVSRSTWMLPISTLCPTAYHGFPSSTRAAVIDPESLPTLPFCPSLTPLSSYHPQHHYCHCFLSLAESHLSIVVPLNPGCVIYCICTCPALSQYRHRLTLRQNSFNTQWSIDFTDQCYPHKITCCACARHEEGTAQIGAASGVEPFEQYPRKRH